MTKKISRLVLLLLLLFFSIGNSVAIADPEPAPPPPFSLDHFRLAALQVLSSSDIGNSFAVSLNWNPEWNFRPGVNLGLNLGWIPLTRLFPNDPMGFEYQVTLGLGLYTGVWFELGAGGESWSGGGSTAPLLTGTFFFRFPDIYLAVLDRAFVSYSSFLASGNTTSEIKLGLGLTF